MKLYFFNPFTSKGDNAIGNGASTWQQWCGHEAKIVTYDIYIGIRERPPQNSLYHFNAAADRLYIFGHGLAGGGEIGNTAWMINWEPPELISAGTLAQRLEAMCLPSLSSHRININMISCFSGSKEGNELSFAERLLNALNILNPQRSVQGTKPGGYSITGYTSAITIPALAQADQLTPAEYLQNSQSLLPANSVEFT